MLFIHLKCLSVIVIWNLEAYGLLWLIFVCDLELEIEGLFVIFFGLEIREFLIFELESENHFLKKVGDI